MTDASDLQAAVAITDADAASTALAVREQSEVQSAITVAKRFPRDEVAAFKKLMGTTTRATFALKARYSFPRGGQRVTGPSVNLAREAARCWGNIRYGLTVIPAGNDRIHIEGWGHDAEANVWAYAQDEFRNAIYRKREDAWVEPDERDLRELINRRGAICVRNAILQVLPPDITAAAVEKCKDTVRRAAEGYVEQDRDQAIRRLAVAFSHIGVTSEMLRTYLNHPLDVMTVDQMTELRGVYKSIADGNSQREEYFVMPNAGTPVPADRTDSLADQINTVKEQAKPKKKQTKKAPAKPA